MSYQTNDDNLFKTGTPVHAKVNPAEKLVIMRYYHRIYYCQKTSSPNDKLLVFFERELAIT